MSTPTPVQGSSNPMTAMLPSVVRTFVPYIAGVLLVALAKLGLTIPEGAATTFASFLVAVGYYAVVRYLETKGNARWGWLLGIAKAPAYSDRPAPSPDVPGEVLVADVEPVPEATPSEPERDINVDLLATKAASPGVPIKKATPRRRTTRK